MSNPYYGHGDGVPVYLSRGTSSTMGAEFDLVATGFDGVYTAVLARGSIAGQVWTGVQDFTGATITVPTRAYGTAGSYAVSVDMLNAAVFSAANLPAQAGKVGYALFTDGGTPGAPYWALIPGTGGTTITGNVTLTVTSAAAMTVTPATPGLYATLPDATTCTKATASYSVYNAGDYDYGFMDSAGTVIGWVRPHTGAVIGLSDSSSAAGVWPAYGLEKIGVTAILVNTTISGMGGTTLFRIVVDANRTCLIFGGTTCYAIVYDASTKTWGAPTAVRATVGANNFCAILSAANQVLVTSCDSTTGMEAVTLTLSGTGITVNTAATATLAGNIAAAGFGQLIAVGSSWVVSYGRATTVSGIRAITISGTAPTIGAESALTPTVAVAANLYASGSVVRTLIASTTFLYAKPYTVSGSSLSAGTQASTATTAAEFRSIQNGNGNLVANYRNTTHFACIFKLTGTVEAASAVTLGTVPSQALSHADYLALSASKTLFVYDASSTAWYANILTDAAGTASAGVEITGTVSTVSAVAGIAVSGTNARVGLHTATAQQQLTMDCSGASPVLSSATSMPYDSANGGGTFGPSDAYGVRRTTTMDAGTTRYAVSSPATATYALVATPSSVFKTAVPKGQTTGALAVVGAANELWFASAFNGTGSVGAVFNRMEAAA